MLLIDEPLLNTRQAALYLGRSEVFLKKLRATTRGPRFLRIGTGPLPRVFYRRADLEAWVAGAIRECTTIRDGQSLAA